MLAADTEKINVIENIGGVDHHFCNGGLHGALNNCRFKESRELGILDIDFSSCYAYIMLLYVPWFWGKMTREQFKALVINRITAKRSGDKATADKLKKIIAPAYGQASKENKAGGNAICAIGQLIMLDLLEKLITIDGIQLINTCTDGVIIAYPKSNEELLISTAEAVKQRLRIPLEYTKIKEIYQQDVNTYVAVIGETFTIEASIKIVQAEDMNELRAKGQTLCPITKEAIVMNLLESVPVEATIMKCELLDNFGLKAVRQQQKFKGLRWNVGGKWFALPDEVKIYATKDKRCCLVGALDYEGKFSRLPATSDNTFVEIKNKLSMELLDKEFYINEANKYIEAWNKKTQRHCRKV